MMGFGEEGKKFPQKFFPSSPITKQPLLGTEPYEKDVAHYITSSHRFYDRFHDIILMSNLLCCNYSNQQEIEERFAKLAENPRDTINLMTHEQYSYSDYFNYIPDHLDRIEKACQLAAANGYQPVWFNEGLMGNTAWE